MSTKRPKRNVKRSQRAQEILDSGEVVPGSPAPSDASVRTVQAEGAIASMIAPDKFRIYDWELPWPTDFLNLSERCADWKAKVDISENDADIDDGSDDWSEVCGAPGYSLERIVANVYIHRAKRAFWAGKSWREFEAEETSVQTQKKVDEVRLAVFDVLKYRLCEEIWLEPHQPPPTLMVTLQIREDSKVEEPADQADFETSDEEDE